jgi:hypothetical protein
VRELVPKPRHRKRDPDTSIDAAKRKAVDQPSECEQLESYLRGHPFGKAAWEIDADLGWGFEEIDRRLSDLHKSNLVFRLNERRAGGGHGPCKVNVHVRFRGRYAEAEVYHPPTQQRAA